MCRKKVGNFRQSRILQIERLGERATKLLAVFVFLAIGMAS